MGYFNNGNEGDFYNPSVNDAQQFGLDYERNISTYLSKTYGWMCMALFISGLAAWFAGHSLAFQQTFLQGFGFWGLVIAEFVLVFAISGAINSLSASVATVLFVLYSAINGLTLGFIFLAYEMGSIVSTFVVCATLFGAMSLYGYTTKTDLTKFGKLFMFALIGIIIASLINFFLGSSMLHTIISCVGVLIFIGLTAYDTQKLKAMAGYASDQESSNKLAIVGALTLYLDFVNLFLYLLRLLGSRRD